MIVECNREKIIEGIGKKKIVAIVRGIYGEECLKLAETLANSGISFIEITFNLAAREEFGLTLDAIGSIKEVLGDRMYIGAGTVTTTETLKLAIDAGANFIISPDVNETVIKKAVSAGLVSIPGAVTPTEINEAVRYGADFVKIFPASVLGSSYIKAICSPINNVKLMAVGGINDENAAEFIAAGVCGLGVGGNLVNKKAIKEGNFSLISDYAKKLVKACG